MIAANIMEQPAISLGESLSCKMIAEASTAKTDSMHIKREATVASQYFCPTICKVYAIPQLRIPEYKRGVAQLFIALQDGVSKNSMRTSEIKPAVKNSTQESFMPSQIFA